MGANNEFYENFERNKYLKKLPSMQRVKITLLSASPYSKTSESESHEKQNDITGFWTGGSA